MTGKPLRTAGRWGTSARGSFSDVTRRAIAARGLSAGAVATAAGIDRRNVERWLAGEKGLVADSLDRIGLALGLCVVDSKKVRAPKPEPQPLNLNTADDGEGQTP